MTLPATISTSSLWSDQAWAKLGPFEDGDERYHLAIDKTNNKLRMFKSTDGGHTWAEQDAADAPPISTATGQKIADAVPIGTVVYAAIYVSSSSVPVARFDMSTDQWLANIASPTITAAASGALGVARIGLVACVVSSVNYLMLYYRGADDTVMSTVYSRLKLHQYNLGTSTWTGPYDVVGSANTPAANTLPGTQVNYYWGGIVSSGARAHLLFRTQNDPAAVSGYIRHRVWQPGNPGTFQAANAVISGTDSSSSGVTYGTGMPTAYTRNGVTQLLVPYSKTVAGVSGGLSVARCDDAATSTLTTDWTQEVVTDLPVETALAGGIPGAVCADGTRCWAWIVDDSQKIWYTQDHGGTTWDALTAWKGANEAFVGGLGALKTAGEIGVGYYDALGAPYVTQADWESEVNVPASTSVYRYAQRFQFATAKSLAAVRVLAQRVIFDTVSLQIDIYADDGSGTKPGGTASIANGSTSIGYLSAPVGARQWYTAKFTTPPSLSASTYYWLVVGINGEGAGGTVYWSLAETTSRAYADGDRATADNAGTSRVWVATADGDMAFHLYTTVDSLPRLRYDRLIVFEAQASLSVGTTSTTYDLGELGPNALDLLVDYGAAGSDPAGAIDVAIEHSHDAGAWIEYAHAGSDAAAGSEVIRLTDVGRYVRVTSTVTGSASVVGVAGV